MQLRITGDGSHTLFLPQMNESYHSMFGAITESMHVFIREGLEFLQGYESISILEAGFGTGLNALLTLVASAQRKVPVTYHTVENFPVDPDVIKRLNYGPLLNAGVSTDYFQLLHRAPWNEAVEITPTFTLHKIREDFTVFNPGFSYDLVYYDAFAPDKQPEMWTREIFTRIFEHLTPGGTLTTYCVKGAVKRTLKAAGFTIEKLPGPPGKREMLRAIKVMSDE
jgi:tRNA U34 5-methylaminomethyl-2-thiouridine-forming methyltransferase MnmC